MDPSPYPTSASKPAFEPRRRASRLALTAALLASPWVGGGCESTYSLAPTACDDYCRALEHADCGEAPADCVRSCEEQLGGEGCGDVRRNLVQCFAGSDPDAFSCVDEQVRVGAVCLRERRELVECLTPGSGPCFDECLRQSEACDVWLDECEASCRHPPVGCETASQQYSACLLGHPVECRAWLQPETRQPKDIPCYLEALGVLACE